MSVLKQKIVNDLSDAISVSVTKENADLSSEDFVEGEFLTLYSFSNVFDDKNFFFSPFTAINDDTLIKICLQANDYRYTINRLGYYDVRSGQLYNSFQDLGTIHNFLKNYSKQYDLVSFIFRDDEFIFDYNNLTFYLHSKLTDNNITIKDKHKIYDEVKKYFEINNLFSIDFSFDDFIKSLNNLDINDLGTD